MDEQYRDEWIEKDINIHCLKEYRPLATVQYKSNNVKKI